MLLRQHYSVPILKSKGVGENSGTWASLTLCPSVTGAVATPVRCLRFKATCVTNEIDDLSNNKIVDIIFNTSILVMIFLNK